jgi:hypothetical protein
MKKINIKIGLLLTASAVVISYSLILSQIKVKSAKDVENTAQSYDLGVSVVNKEFGKLEDVSISFDSLKKITGTKGFMDYGSNPVLKPGKDSEWDAGALGSISVVKAKGIFHMYYEAWGKRSEKNWDAGEYNTLQIGHAVSLDGIHWKKDTANPVLPKGKVGTWDHDGTWDPYVIYENGEFKMWYGGGNKSCNWGYAVSEDGSHFKKEGKISNLGAVEDDHVIHDKKGNVYYMFYWNREFEPDALFRASSGNEKDFNFKDAVHIRIKGEKYPGMYKFTHVIKEGNLWYMFYANFERPHCNSSVTRMAVSSDGLHWTKVNSDILHGQDAELLKINDDLYVMYYNPSGYFDAKDCDIRAAVYKDKLKDLINK